MNYKFKILIVFMSLCLSLCFMSNTYSRYVADTTGNLEMLFAKWQILVNEDDVTNNSSSSIVLTPVIDKNQYIADNKLAPSSTGYVDIDIDPSNVEVSFNYSISLEIVNDNIPDLVITKYAILDSDYTEGNTINLNNIENNLIEGSLDFNNNVIATDSDEIKSFNFEPFTVRIYFEWYEGENEKMTDADDTAIASDAENNKLEVKAEIKFEQKLDTQV